MCIVCIEGFIGATSNKYRLVLKHKPKYQPDNWVLPEMILNFFAFDCWNKDVLCQDTENIRNDFGELVEYVFDVLDEICDSLRLSE